MGKVVVRDSVGASRAWDDFGVHFIHIGELTRRAQDQKDDRQSLEKIEELLERCIEEDLPVENGNTPDIFQTRNASQISPYYRLFLRRLMSSRELSAHETFMHPTACVIAISSSLSSPIETLRQLYTQTAQGSKVLPPYVNAQYLRYYVLVHDEDDDDFAKASSLFDEMKRHFGLHCHLLRLRSSQALPADADSIELPTCTWLSPAEDLQGFNERDDLLDIGRTIPRLFESDSVAVKSFVRELVAQSIVPHMENRIAMWNEQVASRRRGISGRFLSLSKRWTGIGVGGRNSSSAASPGGAGGGATGNYDTVQQFYHSETAEALLRKLADYAFMLRDYKLAASTYDLLRTDYGNDKAWKHLAGADEMSALSNLLSPLTAAMGRTRIEQLDQMMETAIYGYLARCDDREDALRCASIFVELLKVRGPLAAEVSAKWTTRILELGLVAQGSVGHVLMSERVASCFAGTLGIGHAGRGARRRKAALWNILAAEEWMKLGRADFAAGRLDDAETLYERVESGLDGLKSFQELSKFLQQLQLAVRIKRAQTRRRAASELSRPDHLAAGESDGAEEPGDIEETTEQLEQLDVRPHRRSLMGTLNPSEAAPLSPLRMTRPDLWSQDSDDFE